MNITSVDIYMTSRVAQKDKWVDVKPFLFVRLETDQGLHGWGEAYIRPERARAVLHELERLGQQVKMADEMSPRTFTRHIVGQSAEDCDYDLQCAASAIELALWDIWGKNLNAPVYTLFGGAITLDVPLYANVWTDRLVSIEDLITYSEQLAEQGFRAIKMYPRSFARTGQAVESVASVRAALGSKAEIMIDLSVPEDLDNVYELAAGIAPYRPYWFEEPWSGTELSVLADIKRNTGLRVVTGERQCGNRHFQAVLANDAADIINPEIVACGGLIEMLDLAALADAQSIPLSPHCWDSMSVALMAMLHVCAVIPNAEMAEFFPSFNDYCQSFCKIDATITDGVARLGDAPGLGVTMDLNALQAISTHYPVT